MGPVDLVYAPVTLTGAVPTNTIVSGDLVALVSNKAVPVTAFTWTTDLATTQTAFAVAFLGMSTGRSRAATTDPRDLELPVQMDGTIEMDCSSASYTIGQYVGPIKASGNALLNTVAGVATKALAVGVVVKDSGASATKVMVRLLNTPVKK
jgi:hypothetical protein